MRQDPPLSRSNRRHKIQNTARHFAMIDASAKINASANKSIYTTINSNSSQTAQSASDTLKVARRMKLTNLLIQVFLRRLMQICLRFRHSLHHCVTVVKLCQRVGGLEPCRKKINRFLIWRMFEELYAKCNVQKEIKK